MRKRGSSKSALAWISIMFCMLNTYVIKTTKNEIISFLEGTGGGGHLDVHPFCTNI